MAEGRVRSFGDKPSFENHFEMTFTASNSPSLTQRVAKVILRAVIVVCIASTIGWLLNHWTRSMEQRGTPAGFAQGVLQGAMMPCAMPNLLLGKDVTIYASSNTGLTYKLGYTVGVNICGALFFGFSFWRLRRWAARRRSSVAEVSGK